jgi:hypothetical protein
MPMELAVSSFRMAIRIPPDVIGRSSVVSSIVGFTCGLVCCGYS